MFALSSHLRFRLYSKETDMRKGFDGLCGIVQNCLKEELTHDQVFIFVNRCRDKVKVLHWDVKSFLLYYKRLESGTFQIPKYDIESGTLELSYQQLVLMMDGICLKNISYRKSIK